MEKKQVTRPREGRVFFGVAAGLGNYLNIDPAIIRIIFIILAIWGGSGIILYIIGIFLFPEEPQTNLPKNAKKGDPKPIEYKTSIKQSEDNKRTSYTVGLIIIILGLFFLATNFINWLNLGKLWPLLIIILGIAILASERSRKWPN